jgi:hypothetical protein
MTAFGEETVTLMGLAGIHLATYEVFLNMCNHTYTHTYLLHILHVHASSCSIHCHYTG